MADAFTPGRYVAHVSSALSVWLCLISAFWEPWQLPIVTSSLVLTSLGTSAPDSSENVSHGGWGGMALPFQATVSLGGFFRLRWWKCVCCAFHLERSENKEQEGIKEAYLYRNALESIALGNEMSCGMKWVPSWLTGVKWEGSCCGSEQDVHFIALSEWQFTSEQKEQTVFSACPPAPAPLSTPPCSRAGTGMCDVFWKMEGG